MAESTEKISDEGDDVINMVLQEVKKFVGTSMVDDGRREYKDLKQLFHLVKINDLNSKADEDDWNKMTSGDKMAVLANDNSDYKTIIDILQRARTYGIHQSTNAMLTVARYLYFTQDQTSKTKNADQKLEIDNTMASNSILPISKNSFDGLDKNQKPLMPHVDDDLNDEAIQNLSPVYGENNNALFPSNARTSTPATFILHNGVRAQPGDHGNSATYESKIFSLSEQIRLLTEKNTELNRENLKQQSAIDELQSRIAKFSKSSRTADDNDIITPSYVARMMGDAKDKEWKDAFDIMKEEFTYILAMEKLTSIIDRIYAFSQEVAITQLIKLEQHMTKCELTASATYTGKEITEESREDIRLSTVTTKTAKEYRRLEAKSCVPAVQRLYQGSREHSLQPYQERNSSVIVTKLDPYVYKCVELCWYICVQDPPLKLKFTRSGDKIDKEMFSLYENDGEVTKVCVWPALLNSEDESTIQRDLVLPV